MSGVNDVRGIRENGKNLIIVATLGKLLHFRIFDHAGKMVMDTDEKSLVVPPRQIEDLRRQLDRLWPPHKLTRGEKDRVISALTSDFGQSLRSIPSTVTLKFEPPLNSGIANNHFYDQLIKEAVATLPPRGQQFVMTCLEHGWDGLDDTELAKSLGCSKVMVATLQYQALNRLHNYLLSHGFRFENGGKDHVS